MIRAIDKWLPGYIASVLHRPRNESGSRHLIFCVADHFEPLELLERPEDAMQGGYQSSRADRLQIVRDWVEKYPGGVEPFRDSDGQPPRHTFFCAPNDYAPDCMEMLAGLCHRGFGEVELHLHHRNDTAAGLAQKLAAFRDLLSREHGLLGSWKVGGERRDEGLSLDSNILFPEPRALNPEPRRAPPAFGFIHGNWALCNSHPDGDWCGVNQELAVLAGAGCYADFTFPSAPSPTQPRKVNEIYRAVDTGKPRAYDKGVRCEVGGGRQGRPHPLMLIQGPLALDWHRRKWGVFPRLDNGGITHHNPPTPERIDLWVRQGIHVHGRPEWVFVKVYTHGCIPSSSRVFLGEAIRGAHLHLQARYNGGKNWRLHYVTAREMYNIVRAAEDERPGEPGEFRDYEVSPPQGAQ